MNNKVIGFIGFGLLATVLSGLFRAPFFDFYNDLDIPFVTAFGIAAICIGWGPALAQFVMRRLAQPQNDQARLLGSWPLGSVLMALTPITIFAGFGYPNDFGWAPSLAGGALAMLILIYAIGEELGWRGYLNSLLAEYTLPLRSVLIGSLWWVWHLWFLDAGEMLQGHVISFVMIIGLTFLLSAIVDETRSVLSVAAFHSLGNIAFLSGSLVLESQTRWMIAGLSLGILIAIHHIWKRRNQRSSYGELS